MSPEYGHVGHYAVSIAKADAIPYAFKDILQEGRSGLGEGGDFYHKLFCNG